MPFNAEMKKRKPVRVYQLYAVFILFQRIQLNPFGGIQMSIYTKALLFTFNPSERVIQSHPDNRQKFFINHTQHVYLRDPARSALDAAI